MKFIANVEQLRPILAWIREQVAPLGFDRSTLHNIELASEEAVINIIHHAYRDSPETVEVMVQIPPEKNQIEIVFKDFGPPFNPLETPEINPFAELEEREIGGLGIYFIRQLMDEVRYTRERDQNVLVLIKKHAT
jgi:anti-sigma regulatory factor (Ser/Thr protein kinase)